ncbi:MAG: tRNA 2-thiouridine(34) synthase MnmA [Dehalococcoidia bacterium]|nr:tRNA 2-thiouridine(34) synthase MnmA [Dehalococcoidia bacterium]MDZ4247141.1 tRNA 2-thiouridine(34) synthase MnmA [Dehalococcoidia bacterium]
MPDKQNKVFVAMSGGVDSSLAAALLKGAGYDVVGISMHLWCEEKRGPGRQKKPCCSVEDIQDAREVCRRLEIPHYVLNLEDEFIERVVNYFLKEYNLGRTPNPCLACNEHIKFDILLNRILALGGRYLATGHYARIVPAPGGYRLQKARDGTKDQSYVLYTLGQKQLDRLLFPLGDHTKVEVREMAARLDLSIAAKPDSQQICFIPDGRYGSFISRSSLCVPGEIRDKEGNYLGMHQGIAFYTIGQRRGLGASFGRPVFVQRIEPATNTIILGDDSDLYAGVLFAGNLNWVSGEAPEVPVKVEAKIRYRTSPAQATLSIEGDCARVEFDKPMRAITPGQAVVFYLGETVLGGGIIEGTGSVSNALGHNSP